MKITRTITIDGRTNEEYEHIVQYLEAEAERTPGWTLYKDPIANRVTAVKTVEITEL